MSIELTIAALLGHARTYAALRSFITNELDGFLVKLGEQDYRAAINALRDSKLSGAPEREIGMAITCLRLAEQKFASVANRDNFLIELGEGMVTMFTIGVLKMPRLRAAEKFCECTLVIASCYKFLGERELMKTYVQRSREAFEVYFTRYSKHGYDKGMFSGSAGMAGVFRNRAEEEVNAYRPKFIELCDLLEKSLDESG